MHRGDDSIRWHLHLDVSPKSYWPNMQTRGLKLPHIVSRGAQKNFVHFMERLAKQHPGLWAPDDDYYKDLIARAIIFKKAEKCARQHKFPSYRANVVTYTVALLFVSDRWPR